MGASFRSSPLIVDPVAGRVNDMVPANHVHFYEEIFAIPGFLQGPLICFGFQEFEKGATLDGEQYVHLGEYFARLGVRATSLDLFDPRSELRYDMNPEVISRRKSYGQNHR
jgi:hypothetical protein